MTQRTRYFLVGSALVLLVGLGTGLVAYYNGNLPLRTSSVGPAELAYLPVASGAVAYADVRSIMNSEFRQKLRQVLPTGEAKDELLRETGIDLERDIDTVVAGFVPTPGGSPETGAVVIVRGRFNDGQIETLATQHGATVEVYKGKRILTMTAPAGSTVDGGEVNVTKPSGGVAFLEPGLLALGTTAAIKNAIDTAATSADVTKNADLMKLVGDVSGNGNAWIVGQFDAIAASANLPDGVKERMPAVQWFAVSANVTDRVTGVVRADARDDQAAEQLRDIVRGALAAARLVSGNDKRVDGLLSSLQLSGTGKTVALTFTVPSEMLDVINGVAALGNLGTAPHHEDSPSSIRK